MLIIGTVVVMISGCTLAASQGQASSERPSTDRQRASSFLRTIERDFEWEDTSGILDRVSDDYNDGRNYRNDLQWSLVDVFRQYSSIDLVLHGDRVLISDGTVSINVNWDLRWRCTRLGPGCSGRGDVVLRRGSTRFVLDTTESEWELLAQSGNRLLGSMTPGTRTN